MASDIGFIGLGNMGFPMAGHVRKKMPSSATLFVYDVYEPAMKRFVDQFSSHGPIEVANSNRDVATKSKTVISIVPTGNHVRQVYLDSETGIVAAPKDPDRLLLECSTIEIDTTQEVGKAVMAAGSGTYVDTPVSGGVGGAEAGTISFLCGHPGPESDRVAKRVKNTVSFMGLPERIIFCGQLGAGLVGKISNNYISATTGLAVSEAMAFGMRYGVDKMSLYHCYKASSANSWVMDNKQPVPGVIATSPASNNFRAAFPPRMVVKDLSLGVNAAKKVGIEATVGENALKTYIRADQDPRTTNLDCTSIWLHINGTVDEYVNSKTG